MNKYLNRAEKSHIVRMYTIMACAEDLVKYYDGKADKSFLRNLKTGITYMKKAMARRGEFMDEDAKKDWVEQCQRLEPFFVPSLNSYKEYQARMKCNDYLVMHQEDVLDLWTGVIPRTCGRCTGKHKEECNLYKFLLKYNMPVFDANPKGDDCPFSYLASGMKIEHFKEDIEKFEDRQLVPVDVKGD